MEWPIIMHVNYANKGRLLKKYVKKPSNGDLMALSSGG